MFYTFQQHMSTELLTVNGQVLHFYSLSIIPSIICYKEAPHFFPIPILDSVADFGTRLLAIPMDLRIGSKLLHLLFGLPRIKLETFRED